MAKPNRQIDWEAIEREYRTGVLSLREIAARYDVTHPGIMRHAKAHSWTRDLAKQVKARVAEKLITSTLNPQDEAIVEQSAAQVVRVIELHRKDAKQQQDIIRRLMDILQERIMQTDTKPTVDDVRYCGGIMRDCAVAFTKLVGIERQSYGIDEDARRSDPVEEIIITAVVPEVKE